MYKFDLDSNCPQNCKDTITYEYYYRISKNDTIQCDDFTPQYWSQKNRRSSFRGKECMYQGISLLGNLNDAINLLNRFNGRLGNVIFKAKNLENYGKIVNVPSHEPSHLNFYVYKDYCELYDINWEKEEYAN